MDTQKPTGSSEPAEQNQDTTCSVHPKQEASQSEIPPKQGSLVPKGTAIGLAVFAIVLSLSGYGFRLLLGEDVGTVLRHAAVIVPTFVIGIPLFFWLGSRVLNKFKNMQIATRNALALGWLTACVSMLWLMGTYS